MSSRDRSLGLGRTIFVLSDYASGKPSNKPMTANPDIGTSA
jgi:hypothetical protein